MNERVIESVYEDYQKCPFLFFAVLTHVAPRSGGCVRSERSWAKLVGAVLELVYDLSLPEQHKP